MKSAAEKADNQREMTEERTENTPLPGGISSFFCMVLEWKSENSVENCEVFVGLSVKKCYFHV